MPERRRLLLLGGTTEARDLAARLGVRGDIDLVTSLAGRTRHPRPAAGAARRGGFGGSEGLARYLAEASIDMVIDATHPFATTISANTAAACKATGTARLVLLRPPWPRHADDRWISAASAAAAAKALPDDARRVFLSLGRRDIASFEDRRDLWFLVRRVDPPRRPLPLAGHEIILGRGPFGAAAEGRLLHRHRIDTLVSRHSGGEATYGKIAAARALALPVIMIDRPPPPPGERVETVDQALALL